MIALLLLLPPSAASLPSSCYPQFDFRLSPSPPAHSLSHSLTLSVYLQAPGSCVSRGLERNHRSAPPSLPPSLALFTPSSLSLSHLSLFHSKYNTTDTQTIFHYHSFPALLFIHPSIFSTYWFACSTSPLTFWVYTERSH